MKPAWWFAAVAMAAAGVAALWPLSPALGSREALQARLFAILIIAVIASVVATSKRGSSWLWTTIAIGSVVAGVVMLVPHVDATSSCVADYDGRSVIVGRTLSPHGVDYATKSPGSSAADLLLDAGGVPDRLWTPASIRSCRFWLSWGGLSAVPLFALGVFASIARRRFRFAAAPAAAPADVPTRAPSAVSAPRYDAFLSYRHADVDKATACEILEMLEAKGLRVAIDFRDFRPNEHFLSEMERCIKESRFILCVVTTRYLESEHCNEEAIISKTLDMADRRKRLVPLIFERVELPVWLHGLVGIDFTASATVDPFDRLLSLVESKPRPTA